MPSYIVQGGTTLKRMTTAGALTSLTLPNGVLLDSSKIMRGAVLGDLVVLCNSPSENITVDKLNNVRILCPPPPSMAPVLASVAGGTLTGTFAVKMTFVVKDLWGNLLAESAFSPVSANGVVATAYLGLSSVPLSPHTISARRFYRTTTGPGTVYFPWFDLEGNTLTSAQDDLSDVGLALVAAPTDLGVAPQFSNIVAWKDRLWGRPANDQDTLYQSGTGKIYAFPASRIIPIPPANFDKFGITGFLPRKDELGVGKATSIHKITGTNENNFTRVTVSERVGLWAIDSAVVIKDVGYFLGNPFGIYTWSANGIKCISDPKVRAWFTTDTYFNRSRFNLAQGSYDANLNGYRILLSAAGSSALDRWIHYDIDTDTWWGPHITGALTMTGISSVRDANDIEVPIIWGSDGKIYKPQTTFTDGASTAISMDVTTNFLSGDSPDIQKYWGEMAIVSKIQGASTTLTVTPKVGGLDAAAGAAITHDMTLGRQRLRRLGTGRLAQIRLQQNTNAVGAIIYGIELPFHEIGRR